MGVPYTLTAFDPAFRLYIGLGPGLEDKTLNEALKSSTQYQVYGYTAGKEFCPVMATPAPWTPPLVVEYGGVCGYGRCYGPAMLTGEAEVGDAYLLTSLRRGDPGLTKEDFAQNRRLREERSLIPVKVAEKSTFGFTICLPNGVTVANGMRGTPIVQKGHLVGAVGNTSGNTARCRDADRMWRDLIGSGIELSRLIPKRTRIQLARTAYALRENQVPWEADRSLRRQFQAILREDRRIADLEVAVKWYERSGTPIPWRGRHISYKEAQEILLDYHVRQAALALRSQEVYGGEV